MTIASTVQKFYKGRNRIPGLIGGVSSISPLTTVAEDTFTDTDTTNLTAHTMNTGSGWAALTGSITVVSNAAVCQSSTSAYVTQCSRPDVTITCDIKCGAANGNFAPSILLRATDNSNYLQLYFAGDGTFSVYRKIAGSLTLYNTGRSWTADTNWHAVKVICESTRIIVYLDNVLMWEGDVPTFAGGTKFGILGFLSGANKDSFDNFKVVANRRVDTFPGEFIGNDFTDSFTQADTTRLNTFGWTEDAGTWQVNSNKANQTLTAAPVNGYVVSRDIGISDNFGLEVAITTPATGGFIAGLVFRMGDANHYIEAEINSQTLGGFGIWYTNNSGSFVELARQNTSVFDPANSTTYTLRVTVKGRLIIAELVEASIKLFVNSDQFMKATKIGLFEYRDGTTYTNACTYDNYKVYR